MRYKVTVDFVIEVDDGISNPEEIVVAIYDEGYFGKEAIGIINMVPYIPVDDNVELRHEVRMQAAELEDRL